MSRPDHLIRYPPAEALLELYRWRGPVINARIAGRRSAIESLFGPRLTRHADYLGEHLQPLMELTHRLPQVLSIQQRLCTPSWRRAMAAAPASTR